MHTGRCVPQLVAAWPGLQSGLPLLPLPLPAGLLPPAGGAAHSFEVKGFKFDAGPSFFLGIGGPKGQASPNPLKQVGEAAGRPPACRRRSSSSSSASRACGMPQPGLPASRPANEVPCKHACTHACMDARSAAGRQCNRHDGARSLLHAQVLDAVDERVECTQYDRVRTRRARPCPALPRTRTGMHVWSVAWRRACLHGYGYIPSSLP